jgi:hypothetical protein
MDIEFNDLLKSHIKILGILHVILGGMGVMAAVAVMALFGGFAGLVGAADPTGDAAFAIPILGGIGGLVAIILMLFSLPGLIGGIALLGLKPWSRVYMIVISALHLLHVPIGTALGIYGLWILTKPEAEALFRRRAHRRVAASGY